MKHVADTAAHVLELERVALEAWGQGDSEPYLAITADDISYFDPFLNERLDGKDSLRKWYTAFRELRLVFDEIYEPRVQVIGDAAILTMQFISHSSSGTVRWNCTEVYEQRGEQWLIVHTHWSPTKPPVRAAGRHNKN